MKKLMIILACSLMMNFPMTNISISANSQNVQTEEYSARTHYDWWQYELGIESGDELQFEGPMDNGYFLIHHQNGAFNYYHRLYIDFGNETGEVRVKVYCKNPETKEFDKTMTFTVEGKGQVHRDFQVCEKGYFALYTDTFKIMLENTGDQTVSLESVGLVTTDYGD